MNFQQINQNRKDKYYLDVSILDNFKEVIRKNREASDRELSYFTKSIFFYSRAFYRFFLIYEDVSEIAVEHGDEAIHAIQEIKKELGDKFAPNINWSSFCVEEAILLLIRLYGYFRPKKNIFKEP